MALDDLKVTIETLRGRTQTHDAYLQNYESRARRVLIDPMLGVLGWDVRDPDLVNIEYKIGQNRADVWKKAG